MRARCRPLMISLVGLSCAAPRGTGLRAPSTSGGPRALSTSGKPELVATATLGTLTATKWRLGNGLELILLPDPTATSISYMTWFRVGSRHEDEPAGRTGYAVAAAAETREVDVRPVDASPVSAPVTAAPAVPHRTQDRRGDSVPPK